MHAGRVALHKSMNAFALRLAIYGGAGLGTARALSVSNTTGKMANACHPQESQGGSKMLVLCRKLGESIAIAGEIKLQVLGVSGNRVRLGISAPDDCRISRAERHVKEPAQNARRAAAMSLAGSGI
jgi:carbon storage regulator